MSSVNSDRTPGRARAAVYEDAVLGDDELSSLIDRPSSPSGAGKASTRGDGSGMSLTAAGTCLGMSLLVEVAVIVLAWFDASDRFRETFSDEYRLHTSTQDLGIAGCVRFILLLLAIVVTARIRAAGLRRVPKPRSIVRDEHWVSAIIWALWTAAIATIALAACKLISAIKSPGAAHHTEGATPSRGWLLGLILVSAAAAVGEAQCCTVATRCALQYFPDIEPEGEQKTTTKATLKRMMRLFYPDWPYYVAAFCFLVLAALSQIALPWFLGRAIDSVAFNGNASQHDFHENIAILASIAVLCGIFSALRGALFLLAEAKMAVRLNRDLFQSIVYRDVNFFDVTATGEITSRLTSDTTKVTDAITLNINVFLRSFVQAAGVIVFMATLNWKLMLVTFTSIPVVTVISKYYGRYYQKLAKAVQKSFADANEVAEQVIAGIKTVRSFANEDGELDTYEARLFSTYRLKRKQAFAYSGYMSVTTMLPLLVQSLVLWYGGTLIIAGEIKGGTLVSFMFYQMSLSDAINSIGWVFSGMMEALGAAEKVFEYIDDMEAQQLLVQVRIASGEDRDRGGGVLDSKTPGGGGRPTEAPVATMAPPMTPEQVLEQVPGKCIVEFDAVSFAYPARPDAAVLKELSFRVNQGEFVALVGESGGGKSTCMELLQRFYTPTTGEVLVDGVNITRIDHRQLHRWITMVSQEPVLFSNSIAENIGYALPIAPSTAEVKAAAVAANCDAFIMELPNGYATKVGERGTLLSGGQKQRVAIARALVRSPRILLLDESTSALDSQSEQLVQDAIMALRATCTVITIAHRLSTVRDADRIIVIDNGTVAEQGPHDALMRREGGKYRALVQRQLSVIDSRPPSKPPGDE